MPLLSIHLLGSFEVTLNGNVVTNFESDTARALLAYLVLRAGTPIARETLADLLWPEQSTAKARHALSQALNRLRKALSDQTAERPYLLITQDTLQFNLAAEYELDVTTFVQRLTDCQQHAHSATALCPRCVSYLEQAAALYRGDLLSSFFLRDSYRFEEYALVQREQLHRQAIDVCAALATYHESCGRYEQARQFAWRQIELEPWREEAHRQLMRILALTGQRSTALAQYRRCQQILAQDLQVEPEPATTQLYEQILADKVETLHTAPPSLAVSARERAQLAGGDQRGVEGGASLATFVAGPPILHPRQFFGRQLEIQAIFELWRHYPLQNVAIIGRRRSGKTSLLRYLAAINTAPPAAVRPQQRTDWLPQPERYRWVFVDFQDARMCQQERLLRYVLTSLALPVPEPCNLANFLDTVSQRLSQPAIILMDEIGVGLAAPDLDQHFWWSLRSLSSIQTQGQLGFVLAAHVAPAKVAQEQGKPSPFFNIFGYTFTLGPFLEDEARSLIASSPLPFSSDDQDWILAHSECWPYPLQMLCQIRLAALAQGDASAAWRAQGLRHLAALA